MDLKAFHVSPEEHKARQLMHQKKGSKFKKSVERTTMYDYEIFETKSMFANYPHEFALQTDPIFQNATFGAVGTLQSAGCVVFVTAYIISHYTGEKINILKWREEVEKKGYRSWNFENFPDSFTSRYIDLKEVRQKLSKYDARISKCMDMESLYKITGKPQGIGGSMFLIDNVIQELAKKESTENKPVNTRLDNIWEIYANIRKKIMVPLRVNNSIYYNDPKRKGGHYAILIGLDFGDAVMLDSVNGFYRLPFQKLMKAATADENLIAVWDLFEII